jgi:hypothetical protein
MAKLISSRRVPMEGNDTSFTRNTLNCSSTRYIGTGPKIQANTNSILHLPGCLPQRLKPEVNPYGCDGTAEAHALP